MPTLMTRLTGSLAVLAIVAMTSGASAETVLDDSNADRLRTAIEKNWLIPIGMDNMERCTTSLRLHLTPQGVVTQIDVLDQNDDPDCRTLAESARRAVLITEDELGHLPIPPDKYNPTIVVRWPMKLICEQHGGC
jgi:hypothetical protein